MSITEANTYDIGDIIEWVDQRRQYEYDISIDRWKVMRALGTIVVNMFSKKQVKEQDLFKLGDEIEAVKRTPEELEYIESVFKKWDRL